MEEAERPENGSTPKTELSPNAKTCALCGCSTPAVRCDRCSSQIFCLSCDDMYHRHPKRRTHLRKAVDSIWSSSTRSPRIRTRTDWLGDPSKIPIPPPRSKKRHGGRFFPKTNHELGSFGYSKVFDEKKMSSSIKGSAVGQKRLPNTEGNYENDANFLSAQIQKSDEIYENGNVPMDEGETAISTSRNLWNTHRTNAASPAQLSVQPGSPDLAANGQSFGVPSRPQSRSVTDISQQPPHPFHVPHYPYMHPHFNCPQCISSSWSNVMSPHPSPFFHPMPWGPPMPQNGHKHGDNMNQDASFSFPYPGVPFYPNGMPLVDPTTPREMSRVKKSPSVSKEVQPMEDEIVDSEPVTTEDTSTSKAADQNAAVEDDAPPVPAKPKQPWSCLHCTFINPAGILICQVCCKTSYSVHDDEETDALDGRNSESPMELVNLDALRQSPQYALSQKDEEDENICADEPELPDEPVSELPEEPVSELAQEPVSELPQEPVAELSEEPVAELPEEPVAESSSVMTTETQTLTTTTSSDAQTQNVSYKSIASSTDAIFQLQEMSVQTDFATANCSVATDPMISSQSMESLLSGMSAPPYHNRRAGWGRGTSFSTQSLFERGRSHSPLPRTFSQGIGSGRESSVASEEALCNWNQGWLMSDPMYFKPQKFPSQKEDYFDGTWGSMDKLNRRVKNKPSKTLESYQRPKLHRSLGDLKADKQHNIVQTQSLQFLQIVKEAERCGFSLEDLHVAFLHCGKENPVYWLEDNWNSMVKNVIALAAKYGEDSEENDVGIISASEAKESLHIHRGDIWDAVTECIETRQRKILELTVRGNFTQKQIVEALKNNDGNVELAYADLLRAFSRRHKFILSPGMSEDSEDLTQFSPMDDVQDRTVGSSPLKTGVVAESKTDKKKSDFLTKLTAIRNAQSERRKAREEKEMFREGSVLTPDVVESGHDAQSPVVDEVIEKQVVDTPEMHTENQMQKTMYSNDSEEGYKTEIVEDETKDVVVDDSLPVDYDTNWVESQGEWIEEFSDEQWDEEKDEQWNELQKKYKRMENEFEEEAREMVALWEKEELVDDVFDDDIKDEECFETDVLNQEQDEKFQQWVKLDYEDNPLKYEDEEVVEDLGKKSLKESTPLSRSMEPDESAFRNSPLQHYPTKVDLSEYVENDWVEVKDRTEEQFEDMVQIPAVDYKSQDKQYENADILDTEQLAELDNSDVEWEKIDIDAELLEFEKQKHELSDVAKFESDKEEAELLEECFKESIQVDRQTEDEAISTPTLANLAVSYNVENSEIKLDFLTKELSVSPTQIPSEVKPKPPVRRKSKLNTAFIDEVATQQLLKENSAHVCTDVPPALPVKRKGKTIDQTSNTDVYATPEREKKIRTEECKVDKSNIPEPPAKPPRSNLSPSSGNEERYFLSPSKEGSPFSLSNESDSNCFADSESDPEIKYIRQKYMHRKPAKFEEDREDEISYDMAFKKEHSKDSSLNQDEKFMFPSNDDFDFGPELPIPLGSRRLKETELSTSPKAFREGTARPLQLFKAPEKETPAIKDVTSPSVVEAVSLSLQSYNKLAHKVSSTPSVDIGDTNKTKTQTHVLSSTITDLSYYNIAGSTLQDNVHDTSTNLTAQKMDSNLNILNEENAMKNVYDINQQLHLDNIELDLLERSMTPIQEDVFLEESNVSPTPATAYPEDLLLPEEGLFAAADYFFGRYNEVVVAKPKKKTHLTKVPKKDSDTVTTSKSLTTIEQLEVTNNTASLMQTMSLINPTEAIDNPSLMKTELTTTVEPASKAILIEAKNKKEDLNIPSEIQQFYDAESKSSKLPEPSNTSDTEYVSFAEDYFFGSYNEVVIPKKGKKRPATTVSKPKTTQDLRTSLFQSALSMDVAGPVPSIPHSMSASVSTPGQTSLGAGIPVGEITQNGADSKTKVKSVHFEDPQPEPPPRRNRIKVAESDRSSLSSYVSISDDYSYEQFHDCVEDFEPPDKKKLSPYSGDFKMIPDFDPYKIPSESYFYPSGELNSSVSSETSIYTYDNNNLCSQKASVCSSTGDEAYTFHEACLSLEMTNFMDLENDPAFNELSPISCDPISNQNTIDESLSNIIVDIETNDNSLEVNDRFISHETEAKKTSEDISNFITGDLNTILSEDKTRKYHDVCHVPELISLPDETHRISPSSFCFQKQSVEKASITQETRTNANNSLELRENDHDISASLNTNVNSYLQKQSNKEVFNIQEVITNADNSVQFRENDHDITTFPTSNIKSYVEKQSNEVSTVQKTINNTDNSMHFKENNRDITTSLDINVDSFYTQKQSDEEIPNAREETNINNLMQLKINYNDIALYHETNDEMVDKSSEKPENKIPNIRNLYEKEDLNKILDTEIKNLQQSDENMNKDLVIKTLYSIHVNPTANEANFIEGSEISSMSQESNLEESVHSLENDLPPSVKKTTSETSTEPYSLDFLENLDMEKTGTSSSSLSKISKEFMLPQNENPDTNESKYSNDSCTLDDFGDLEYLDRFNEDFEDGLRLVEEAQNLINEFDDIFPLESFKISLGNEVIGCSNKNNRDLSYDSENEWKINEERNNSRNANFIENKIYKMDVHSNKSAIGDNLLIDTITSDSETPKLENVLVIDEEDASLKSSSTQNDLMAANDNIFPDTTITAKSENLIVQPLAVLCQDLTSAFDVEVSVLEALSTNTDSAKNDNIRDKTYVTKSDSLTCLNVIPDESINISDCSSAPTNNGSNVNMLKSENELNLDSQTKLNDVEAITLHPDTSKKNDHVIISTRQNGTISSEKYQERNLENNTIVYATETENVVPSEEQSKTLKSVKIELSSEINSQTTSSIVEKELKNLTASKPDSDEHAPAKFEGSMIRYLECELNKNKPPNDNDLKERVSIDVVSDQEDKISSSKEPFPSLMSHFYDELYETAKPVQSLMQQDLRLLYATYECSTSSTSSDKESIDEEYEEVINTVKSSQPEFSDDEFLTNSKKTENETNRHTSVISLALDPVSIINENLEADNDVPSKGIIPVLEIGLRSSDNQPENVLFQTEDINKTNVTIPKKSTTKDRFCVSKHCQTEDSFEEDIFFDSFDDGLEYPVLKHLVTDKAVGVETVQVNIGIQCNLITEDAASINKLDTPKIVKEVDVNDETVCLLEVEHSIYEEAELELLNYRDDSVITCKSEEENSSDSSSDSDLFLEPQSLTEYLDSDLQNSKNNRHNFLYTEADSDTGFSSGSESGKRILHATSHIGKTEVGKGNIELSICMSSKLSETTSSNLISEESTKTGTSIEKIDDTVCNLFKTSSGETSRSTESIEIVQPSATSTNYFPQDIIDRAVTPILIRKVPSIEDIVFVEVPYDINEEVIPLQIHEEPECTRSPTIEFFYGPPPFSVCSELQEDKSESFIETVELLEIVDSEKKKDIYDEIATDCYVEIELEKVDEEEPLTESEYFSVANSDILNKEISQQGISSEIKYISDLADTSISRCLPQSELRSEKFTESNVEKTQCCDEMIQKSCKEAKSVYESSENKESRVVVSEPDVIVLQDSSKFCVTDSNSTVLEENKLNTAVCDESFYSDSISEYFPTKNDVLNTEKTTDLCCSNIAEYDTMSSNELTTPLDIYEEIQTPKSNIIKVKNCETKEDVESIHLDSLKETNKKSVSIPSEVRSSRVNDQNDTQKNLLVLSKNFVEHLSSTIVSDKTTLEQETLSKDSLENLHQDLVLESQVSNQSFSSNNVALNISNPNMESSIPINEIVISSDTITNSIEKSETELLNLERDDLEDSFHEAPGISTGVPVVPSDIVRYLYYDDSIKFDPDSSCQDDVKTATDPVSKLHCPGLEEEKIIYNEPFEKQVKHNLKSMNSQASTMEQIATDNDAILSQSGNFSDRGSKHFQKVDFEDNVEKCLISELSRETSNFSQIEISLSDSNLNEMYSIPSKSVESENLDWFDAEKSAESLSEIKSMEESEQKTNSITKEDHDFPCIPELILDNKRLSKDLTKMDIDEVTDISTHFTMTDDDSDKFSDITNDSSISCFEEDNSLSVDIEISKKEEVRFANENMIETEQSLNLANDNQSTESMPHLCRKLESGGIENFNKVIESPISKPINSKSEVIFNEKGLRIDQGNIDQAVTNSNKNEFTTELLELEIFSIEKEDVKAEDIFLDSQTDDIDSWKEACDESDTGVEDLQFFSPEDISLHVSEGNKLSEKRPIPSEEFESLNLTERNINNYETKEFVSDSSPKGVDNMPDPVSDVTNPEYILNFRNVKDVTIPPDDVCCVEVTNYSDGGKTAVTFIRMEPSEFDADSTNLDFPSKSKSVSMESIQTVVDQNERTLQRSDIECHFIEAVIESKVCLEKHGASKEFALPSDCTSTPERHVHDVEIASDILNYNSRIGSFTNDDKECLKHETLEFDSHCSSDTRGNMDSMILEETSSYLTDICQPEEINTPPNGDAQSVIIEITSITSETQEKDSSSDLSYHSLSDASISDFEEESEILQNNAQNGHYQESDTLVTLEEEVASTTVSSTVNTNVKEPLAEIKYLEKSQETHQIREVKDNAFECSATSPESPPYVEPPVSFKSLENIQFNDTKDHEVSLPSEDNVLQISSDTTSSNLNSLCSSVVAKNSQEDLIALSSALVEPSDNCSVSNENKAQHILTDSNLELSTHTIALETLTSDIKQQSSVVNVTELINVSDVKQFFHGTELDKSVSLDSVHISSECSNDTIVCPSTLQLMLSSNETSLDTAKQESICFSETDSSSYFSAHEDIENISSICSDDDFTDVESHFTVTDSSDVWDDVETDVSIGEDFEIGKFLPSCRCREQTPTLGNDFTALESEIEHSAKAKEISLSIGNEHVCSRNGEPIILDGTLTKETDLQLSNNNAHLLQTISESKTMSEEVLAGTNVKHTLFENSESSATLDEVSVKIEALHCEQNKKNEITDDFKIIQENDLQSTKSKEEEYNNDNTKEILTTSHEDEEMNPERCKKECSILKLITNLGQTLDEDVSDAISFNSISSECEKLSDSEASNIFDNSMVPCPYDKDLLDNKHLIQDIDSVTLKKSTPNVTNIQNDQTSTCNDGIFLVEQTQLNTEASESDSVPKLHESSVKELSFLSQENIAVCSDETKNEIVNVSEKFNRTDIISDLDKSLSSSLVQDFDKNIPDIPGIIDSNEKEFSVCGEVETSFKQTDECEISFVSLTKDDFSDKSNEIESFADFDDSKSIYEELSKPEYIVSDEKLEQFDLPSSSKALKISADTVASESNIRCTENILLENFADVKSLNEQSSLAETYVEFDAVIAVPLIHDENTEKSLCIEKTEDSDNWLEADTEYSISEFEDEAVSISVNEMWSASAIQDSVVLTDNRVELEKASSLEHSSDKMTDFSVSFHTDTEHSDKVSDTCAEISLQGFTTENSDKWSDIEGDEINVEQYHKNAQFVGTNVKVADVIQVNMQEECLVEQTNIREQNLDVEISSSLLEQKLEVSVETLEDKHQIETNNYLKKPEPLISDNQPISGVSDEDFTDVTPLDGTSDDSDKWSDISDVASIDEILDKDTANSRQICHSNNASVLCEENENGRNKLEEYTEPEVLSTSKEAEITIQNKLNLVIETPQVDKSFEIKGEELLKQSEETAIVFGDTIAMSDTAEISEKNIVNEKEKISTLQSEKTIHSIEQVQSTIEEASNSVSKPLEDKESLKVEELNLDGNLHSIQTSEDFIHGENFTAEENAGNLDEFNYDYGTNEFDDEVRDENAEFDDEEYVSEPFVINDDEFVYPIQYDNWIEESFDLKEYGIDGAFSESEEDFYTKAEEDIQRAIDFSTGTFEEAMESIMDEENITTESFKTLSSHATTFSKPTEKEYESWSTADAESIEDDLNDDEVLSKIDELLAEEFGCDNSAYKETIFDTIQEKEEELELSELSNVKTTQDILESGIPDSFETERDLYCPKTEELSMVTNDNKMAESFENRSTDKDKGYMNNIPKYANNIPVKQEEDHVNSHKLKMKEHSEVEKEQARVSQIIKDEKTELKIDELFTYKVDKNTEKNKESLESKIHNEETESKKENLKDFKREESSIAKMKDTVSTEQNIELIEEKSTVSTKDLKNSESQQNSTCFKNEKNTEPKKENSVDLIDKDKTVQNQTSKKSTEELKMGELSKSERKQSENEKKERIVKEQETMLLQSKITADEIEKGKSHSESEKEAKTMTFTSTEKTEKSVESIEEIRVETQDSTNKESNFEFQKEETKDSKKCIFTLKDEKVALKKVKETSSSRNEEKKELEEDVQTDSTIKTNLETDLKRERNKITVIDASSENKTTKINKEEILDATEIKKTELRKEKDINQNDEHKNSQSKKEMEDAHNEIKNSKFEKDKLSESHIIESKKTNVIKVSSENKNVEITKTKTIDSVEGLEYKTLKSATQEDIQSTTPTNESAKSSHEFKNETKEISRSDKFPTKVENIPPENEQNMSKDSKSKKSLHSVTNTDEIKSEKTVVTRSDISSTKVEDIQSENEQKKTKDSKSKKSLHSVTNTDEVKREKTEETRSDISSTKVEDVPSKNEQTKSRDSTFKTSLLSATNTDEAKSEKTSVTRNDKSSTKIEDIPSEYKPNVSSDSSSTMLSPSMTDAALEESLPTKTDVLSQELASKPELSVRRRRSRPNTEPDTEENIPGRRRRSSLLRQAQATQSEAANSEQVPSLPPKRCRSGSASSSDSLKSCLSLSSESLSYDTPLKDDSISEPLSPKDDEVAVPDVPLRKARIRPTRNDSSEDSSSASTNKSSSWSRGSMPVELAADPNRKRTSIDERMLKLHTEGKCTNKEKAFIAAKLIEMQFEEEDALLASRQCSSVYHAVKFLTQLCELCNCRFPVNLMASMVYCTHRACRDCLKAHFTNLIYDRSVFTLLCPICHKPDITDHNIQEYFNHLEMMFRDILESNVYDLFQRKLRDEVLTKDPNFHWCSQCSNGFIASPRLKKLYCPDCSAITCASCHQTWELEHEGVHCERFQQWKDMHTPEPPPAGLVKFLTDRGITCPSCGIVYAQACGGCILYRCAHCSHEFCGFCSKPYNRGKDCLNKGCDLRGVHAHHKLNCLFFLRDKDLSELQLMLEEEGVQFLTLPPKDQIVKSRCQVREQKHAHGTLSEDRCIRDIVPYCAGLCRTHYYEYLCELLRRNKIDPLSIITISDLQLMLRKSRIFVPEKVKGETNDEFYARLSQVVAKALS